FPRGGRGRRPRLRPGGGAATPRPIHHASIGPAESVLPYDHGGGPDIAAGGGGEGGAGGEGLVPGRGAWGRPQAGAVGGVGGWGMRWSDVSRDGETPDCPAASGVPDWRKRDRATRRECRCRAGRGVTSVVMGAPPI